MQYLKPKKIVLIGASTGGPGQIEKIIKAIPKLQHTSVVIAQHMADGFLNSFVNQLQQYTTNKVVAINNGDKFESNKIYLSKYETLFEQSTFTFRCQKPHTLAYNPDINIVFNSFVDIAKKSEILCVILTGIGNDGVSSCKKLHSFNTRCITETKQSSIIDGMPSSARELIPNIEVYNIDKIVTEIKEFCE